ncbi:hypothetical protein AGMMS50262_09960 [Bacteroidia bacterium]|nr:hypothetical protein AGMMS50262_09960 [Bacteroidia bacterium]
MDFAGWLRRDPSSSDPDDPNYDPDARGVGEIPIGDVMFLGIFIWVLAYCVYSRGNNMKKKKKLYPSIVVFCSFWLLSMAGSNLQAQTTTTTSVQVTYGSLTGNTGTFNPTIPSGITNLQGQLWGAGGSGGAARACGYNAAGTDPYVACAASGGGGGEYNTFNFGTYAGSLTITVGQGNTGQAGDGNIECRNDKYYDNIVNTYDSYKSHECVQASAGAYSRVVGSSTVTANGGQGGWSSAIDANAAHGYGSGDLPSGSDASSTGGAGGTGGGGTSGSNGGAGAASQSGQSYSSTGGYGGSSPNGGAQVNMTGGSTEGATTGNGGNFPGGGGAGGSARGRDGGCDVGDGGSGANGQVIITFSYSKVLPVIDGNPVRELTPGATFYLTVNSAASATQDYQWFKDGVEISGQTGTALEVSAPGEYTVQTKNKVTETINFTGAVSVSLSDNNDVSSVIGTTLTVGSINEWSESAVVKVVSVPAETGISVWSPNYAGHSGTNVTDSTNWFDNRNWYPGNVPTETSRVYIPSYDLVNGGQIICFPYLPAPTLTDTAKCERIYIMHGAEIGNPQYLKYNGAFFQYNLGLDGPVAQTFATKTELDGFITNFPTEYDHLMLSAGMSQLHELERGQWHLLSAPMRSVLSGDYAFGGVPRTFIRKFDADTTLQGSAFKGNWTDYYTSQVVPLAAAEGFAVWINDYQDKMYYRETETGLDENAMGFGFPSSRTVGLSQINGILEFPYSDINHVLQFDKHQLAHRTHTLDGVQRTVFYYYQMENLALRNSTEGPIQRGNPEYFNFDAANGQANGSGIVQYTINQGAQSSIALIGNPFPTTIDFDQFINDNPGKIKNGYTTWTGTSFDSYLQVIGTGSTTTLTKYIAPGQGFLVELLSASAALSFNPATLSVRRTPSATSVLHSIEVPASIITIEVSNKEGSRQTFIVQNDNGQTTVSDWDMSKIITSFRAFPEVYTLKNQAEGRPLGVVNNVIPKKVEMLIPVGIATTASGKLHFSLSGMEKFDGKVIFVDAQSGETDISGSDLFEYNTDYTPAKNSNNEVLACENRFFIRVSSQTAVNSIDKSDVVVRASTGDWGIRFYSNYPIQSLALYDIQGRLIHENTTVKAFTYDVNCKGKFFVAKVVTDFGVKQLKIIR